MEREPFALPTAGSLSLAQFDEYVARAREERGRAIAGFFRHLFTALARTVDRGRPARPVGGRAGAAGRS